MTLESLKEFYSVPDGVPEDVFDRVLNRFDEKWKTKYFKERGKTPRIEDIFSKVEEAKTLTTDQVMTIIATLGYDHGYFNLSTVKNVKGDDMDVDEKRKSAEQDEKEYLEALLAHFDDDIVLNVVFNELKWNREKGEFNDLYQILEKFNKTYNWDAKRLQAALQDCMAPITMDDIDRKLTDGSISKSTELDIGYSEIKNYITDNHLEYITEDGFLADFFDNPIEALRKVVDDDSKILRDLRRLGIPLPDAVKLLLESEIDTPTIIRSARHILLDFRDFINVLSEKGIPDYNIVKELLGNDYRKSHLSEMLPWANERIERAFFGHDAIDIEKPNTLYLSSCSSPSESDLNRRPD